MISGKLKSIFCSRKIRRALDTKSPSFEGLSGKAGLIIDAENLDERWKLAELYRLADINKENFRVVVCSSREDLQDVSGAEILDPREISLTGEFKSGAIRAFAEEQFDFIICHFSERSYSASLLAAVSKATVKIGNRPDDYGIYDVEIDSEDIEVFQQEALKYLKILKKNN